MSCGLLGLSVFIIQLLSFIPTAISNEVSQRVHNLLTIGDVCSACRFAEQSINRYSDVPECWEACILALAASGDQHKMLARWKIYAQLWPERSDNRQLLEGMAWGLIDQAAKSPSPIVRIHGLLGAFFGQDARGVEILRVALSDPNTHVRGAAIQLCAQLRDPFLQDETLRLLQRELNLQVKVETIKALGKMKIPKSEEVLIAILVSPSSRAEEKKAAVQSLLHLLDHADAKTVSTLVFSQRSSLRELGARVILHTGQVKDASLLSPLFDDSCADVRQAALEAFAYLRIKTSIEKIKLLFQDSCPRVAITAAWALTLLDAPRDFSPWLRSPNQEIRLLASGALSATGKFGKSNLLKAFRESRDPFVKMNLALGLIKQREALAEACAALLDGLNNTRERIMWRTEGSFKFLGPSTIPHVEWMPHQPESVDQMTRLELYNILLVLEDPQALSAVRNFLKNTHWGVTGMSSALLLQEGEAAEVDLIASLLNDPHPRVRTQAALILAIWGRREDTLPILQEAYLSADREMKERIIEGIGRVGAKSSLPFLVERLGEAHPTLRIIGAASLLQCLYH